MICHSCGETLEKIDSDLPFKTKQHTIIIIKNLPVLQCKNCSEYLIEDPVMGKIDILLNKVDKTAELEILTYAA
ncbi:MAG: YgiT-type zinc finger protein [Nitrospirae bacterium]|nr:YgiT-type zinc finger protein [Nitrospirota bacterium]